MSAAEGGAGNIDVQKLLNQAVLAAQREIEAASTALRERGAGRFGRIAGLGLAAVFLSYHFFYSAAATRRQMLDRRIGVARATARYADRYNALRQQLDAVNTALGAGSDRSGWLIDQIRGSLNAEGLVPESMSPPEEQAAQGYVLQTVHFTTTTRFGKLVSWLNRLEDGALALQVTSLELHKISGRDQDIGTIKVDCAVSTILPGRRPGL